MRTSIKRIRNLFQAIINVYLVEGFGWCRETIARDQKGQPCQLSTNDVKCVCALGAMNLVIQKRKLSTLNEHYLILDAHEAFYNRTGHELTAFNDIKCKRKETLINTLKTIIKDLK